MNMEGWMGYILSVRLRTLKGVIKNWNTATFGEVGAKKKGLVNDILALDLKSEVMGLDDMEVMARKKLFDDLWRILKNIDALNFQRSRSRWLKEGDSNSKFFHNYIKTRKRRNNLTALRTPRGWVEGPNLVRREVVAFFKDHFEKEVWRRPNLNGITFPQLSLEKVGGLTACFSMEEITEVVMSSDGSKSPGPDGFNFAFIKGFWDLLKNDVRIMFDQFHANATLSKGMSSYFLTLIPKVSSPQSLGDFRPISLLG
jgi:hypothetical protein